MISERKGKKKRKFYTQHRRKLHDLALISWKREKKKTKFVIFIEKWKKNLGVARAYEVLGLALSIVIILLLGEAKDLRKRDGKNIREGRETRGSERVQWRKIMVLLLVTEENMGMEWSEIGHRWTQNEWSVVRGWRRKRTHYVYHWRRRLRLGDPGSKSVIDSHYGRIYEHGFSPFPLISISFDMHSTRGH